VADTHKRGSETTLTDQRDDCSITHAANHDKAAPNSEGINCTSVSYAIDKFDEASLKGEGFSCSSVNPIGQLAALKRQAALGSEDLSCFPVNSIDQLDETTLKGQDMTG